VSDRPVSYTVHPYLERNSGSPYVLPEFERIVSGHPLDRCETEAGVVRLVRYTPPGCEVFRFAVHTVLRDGRATATSYRLLAGARVDYDGAVVVLGGQGAQAQEA